MNVISFDIDDTLLNNNIVETTLLEFGLDPNKVEVKWRIEDMDIPEEVISAIKSRFKDPEYIGNILPNPGSKNAIDYFNQLGYKIIAVTARSSNLQEITGKRLNEYFDKKIDEIHCVGPISKSEFFKKLGVDIIVDDNPEVIDDCLGMDIIPKIYFVTNERTPHNHKMIHKYIGNKNVTIINSLMELTNV